MIKSRQAFFSAETYFDENEKDLDRAEPAWAKAALALRTGMRFGHPSGQTRGLSIIKVKEQLDVFKKRAEKGDGLAVLHAIRYCADENVPMPTWLALDFIARFDTFLRPDGPSSLDEAFPSKDIEISKGVFLKGIPRSGKRAAALRRDWQTGLKIWWNIWDIADDHPSLDSALDAVLEQGNYSVEKTKARELVLMIDENQKEFLGGQHKYQRLVKYFSREK